MTIPSNSISASDVSNQLALDTNSLSSLKKSAVENSPEAIKGVAKQFEAIFINMMLKSMREASPQDGAFNTEQNKLYTSMFDQQLSQKLASGKGVGLADVLVKQLTKAAGIQNDPLKTSNDPITSKVLGLNRFDPNTSSKVAAYTSAASMYGSTKANPSFMDKVSKLFSSLEDAGDAMASSVGNAVKETVDSFASKMASYAQQASNATGLPANFMLGQAALETGWGKKEIKGSDGTQSNNLFGIKAGGSWTGKTVSAVTTEYINGEKQTRVEKFRAYDSYADSFKDFANMISSNPRYQNVLKNLSNINSYADAMAKAGYATDPEYAKKLASVIKKIDNPI
jgi:peptidoglycan hydrolase FlgJ